MTQFSDAGIERSDGSVIGYANDAGTIRRRDIHRNLEELRQPGDDIEPICERGAT